MTSTKHDILALCITALLSLLLAAGCGDDDGAPDDDHDAGHDEAGSGGSSAGSGGSNAGSGGAEDASAPGGIEVAGMWSSMFGDETIDDTMWNGASIVSFDNDDNSVITQDPPSEDDAGVETEGAFNKIVWTEIEGDAFYYCWVSFGQASAADADANEMPSDDSDPDNGGCGDSDFPWTKLERM